MNTIINRSAVTDYSGQTPIVTYSNPVTTVLRQNLPEPIITRYFYRIPCFPEYCACRCCNCYRCCCDEC